jgi:hypothetical protein
MDGGRTSSRTREHRCLGKLQMANAKCHHVEVEASKVVIVVQTWSLVTIGFPSNGLSLPREGT